MTEISHDQDVLSSKPDTTKPPSFLLPIFKLPLLLYRINLGWLMGKRFMQLTHLGRRTGKVHKTVLAVLHFNDQTKEIRVISAWSACDWYRNIQAKPALRVEMGVVDYVPDHRIISPEEIASLFTAYRNKHPLFSKVICKIPGWKWDSTYEEFLELARTLRGVAFRPK